MIAATLAALALTSGAAASAQVQDAGRVVTGDQALTLHCATPVQDRQMRAVYAEGMTFPDGRVLLRGEICALALTGGADPRRAWAVEVIAHELGHASLHTRDECRAETYGMAHWQPLAKALGVTATPRQVRYLAHAHYIFPAC